MDKINRKIPATMATQHPDHASRPFWYKEAFIPAIEEARECFLNFADLGITEYKWDWEGKLVDESVLERLIAQHFEYFKKHPIGKDKFLTFRLPNPKVQTEFRMSRALMRSSSVQAGFRSGTRWRRDAPRRRPRALGGQQRRGRGRSTAAPRVARAPAGRAGRRRHLGEDRERQSAHALHHQHREDQHEPAQAEDGGANR